MLTRNERLAVTTDGSFVVFLIGMRVNRPLLLNKWLPIATAMPRMLRKLVAHPEMGFLHAESSFGRTTMMVQYWRSLDRLLAYAHDKEAAHLPAWRAFNKAVGTGGAVGIWHETYVATPGNYENIYVNIPPSAWARRGRPLPPRAAGSPRLPAWAHGDVRPDAGAEAGRFARPAEVGRWTCRA